VGIAWHHVEAVRRVVIEPPLQGVGDACRQTTAPNGRVRRR
jgi:hypothetical protein